MTDVFGEINPSFGEIQFNSIQTLELLFREISGSFGGISINELQKALSDSFGKGFCFGF
jgi:hypothetical protein